MRQTTAQSFVAFLRLGRGHDVSSVGVVDKCGLDDKCVVWS